MQRPCSRRLLSLLKEHCGWSRQWEKLKSEREEGLGTWEILVRTLVGGHLLLLEALWDGKYAETSGEASGKDGRLTKYSREIALGVLGSLLRAVGSWSQPGTATSYSSPGAFSTHSRKDRRV